MITLRHITDMRLSFYFLVIFYIISNCKVNSKSYSRYNVFEFTPKNEMECEMLKIIPGDRAQIEIWNPLFYVNTTVIFHTSPEEKNDVIEYFAGNKLDLKLRDPDLEGLIKDQNQVESIIRPVDGKTDIDLNEYYSLAAIYQYLELAAMKYPNIVQVDSFGYSYQKTPLLYIRISDDFRSEKPVILIDCGMHPREWITPAICVYFIHELTAGFNTSKEVKELLNRYEINIIPIMNPDGYEYSKIDRLWRKNRNPTHDKDKIGVDLNRNFENHDDAVNVPLSPCYGGPYAFSEPELQGFKDLNLYLKNLRTTLTFHSSGNLWMFPYGRKAERAPNHDEMLKQAQIGAKALGDIAGTKYTIGTIHEALYKVHGGSLDWQYDHTSACSCFSIELSSGTGYSFFVPKEEITAIGKETFHGVVTMLNSMKK